MRNYTLSRLPQKECEESYAREGVSIRFQFNAQSAIVKVLRLSQEAFNVPVSPAVLDNRLSVHSCTDGYHWLQYWMAQTPDTTQLVELPHDQEVQKIRGDLRAHGFDYEPEDKETCYVTSTKPSEDKGDLETIATRLADFIAPRFALRERFHPND